MHNYSGAFFYCNGGRVKNPYKISKSSRKSKISSFHFSAAVRPLRTMKRRSTPHKHFISLEDTTAEKRRCENITSTKNCYLTSRAIEQSDEKAVKRHKKAKHARSCVRTVVEDSTFNALTAYSTPVPLIDGMAEKRRAAIEYFYINIYDNES